MTSTKMSLQTIDMEAVIKHGGNAIDAANHIKVQ